MIVSNTENNPARRDRELRNNAIVNYMQERYLDTLRVLALQANRQNKIFDEFDGVISLKHKCAKELGYA